MSLEAEFDEVAPEMDGAFSREIVLIDSENGIHPAIANVGEFMEGREFTERTQSFRVIQTARIVITRESNPDLERFLGDRGLRVIPAGWECSFDGETFFVSGSMSDGISFTFDIQPSIS